MGMRAVRLLNFLFFSVDSMVTKFIRPNGVRFLAAPGSTEFTKRWNPQPGDLVSFKHHGFLLKSKKPKLPTLYRVRTDVQWEDVVKSWKDQTPLKSSDASEGN